MRTKSPRWQALVLMLLLAPLPAQSDAPSFRITEVTPVGSWAEREQHTIDQNKKETVMIMRQKLIDKEKRDGETYYWVETESTSYKINKKGDRKKQGDTAIMKALVAESALNGDPANLANNLSGFGKEIIMQSGNSQPMRMREGGAMAGFMMKSLGVKTDYKFTHAGNEEVDTPAGKFKAEKFSGTGSVETRVLMSKMSVQSESEFWMTSKVPFGFAKMKSRDTMNGKPQMTEAYVTSFGMSGATSSITGEPVDFMGEGGLNLKDLMPGG